MTVRHIIIYPPTPRGGLKKLLSFLKSPLGSRDFGIGVLCIFSIVVFSSCSGPGLTLSCSKDNDLYLTLTENNVMCSRFENRFKAIANARKKSGVLILADGYPRKTTSMDSLLFT